MKSEQFLNTDGTSSHWSVVANDDLVTCVMHDTEEECDIELAELAKEPK